MRLLNAKTYQLHSELGQDKPKYAILSHTWEEEEVLFEDIRRASRAQIESKRGFYKIQRACEQALADGYDFVWIDTCCINKGSSAELSEAINSMFRWYTEASVCYAYLSDAGYGKELSLSHCRWFGRGWTLQELLAPDHVHFYDRNWSHLGSRISLATEIASITGIHDTILIRGHTDPLSTARVSRDAYTRQLNSASYVCWYCGQTIEVSVRKALLRLTIAQRMTWASKRETTRLEDSAYSLMGLFEVHMPLIYGEGAKAFYRLQEAILKRSRDHSILAFRATETWARTQGSFAQLLAPHPSYFRDDIRNEWMPYAKATNMNLVGNALSMELSICPLRSDDMCLDLFRGRHLGILDCTIGDDPLARPAILLEAIDDRKKRFRRCAAEPVLLQLSIGNVSEAVLLRRYADEVITRRVEYNPKEIKRCQITIVEEEVEEKERLWCPPIRINIAASTSPTYHEYVASPGLVGDYVVASPKDTIHVLAFYSQDYEDYFIAWGSFAAPMDRDGFNEGLWCRIWTLSQLFELFENAQSSPREDVHVEDVVREVAFMNIADGYTPRDERFPARGEVVLWDSTSTTLKIKAFISRISFLGRAAFQLNVMAETQDEAQSGKAKIVEQRDGTEHTSVAKLVDAEDSEIAPYLEMPLFDMTD
ncbi:HET domain containing protein [Pyrenophora tritici-repentis]|nr:HET domain containing protein [Pyrenophora tritici-repentis]